MSGVTVLNQIVVLKLQHFLGQGTSYPLRKAINSPVLGSEFSGFYVERTFRNIGYLQRVRSRWLDIGQVSGPRRSQGP